MTLPPRTLRIAAIALVLAAIAPRAWAYDPSTTFTKGAYVLSVEGGGGTQHNVEDQLVQTGLEFWNAGVRLGYLPWGATSPGPLRGAFEVGLEPFYQHYTRPVDASFGGLGLAVRYHFLSLGRFVPYAELFGAAGGTDLKVTEIRSTFTFLVFGGLGAEVMLTDRSALYAGDRMQHVSNGNTSNPNRGFESHGGVFGVSYFFP